jgi:dihydrofolate reductase
LTARCAAQLAKAVDGTELESHSSRRSSGSGQDKRKKEMNMRKLGVFNNVSLDGYFTDAHGDMSWAHKQDPEWQAFSAENASGGGTLMFGRVTYEMMAGFWPTPAALKSMPVVAEKMNKMPKVVFSKTLKKTSWENTEVASGDIVTRVRKLKESQGSNIVIMGSGSIVAQLTQARLIDTYQVVVVPLVLGSGRTMFDGVKDKLNLKLEKTRAFENGNVVLWYQPTQA